MTLGSVEEQRMTQEQAPKPGPKPSGNARGVMLTVRVHEEAAQLLGEVAAANGKTLSEAMREALGDWVVANRQPGLFE